MRIPIIAGNWKMNKTMEDTEKFINALNGFSEEEVEAILCVPFTDLVILKEKLDSRVKIGSQNIHWQESGAFTGEISPLMLKELNVQYAIIGHSERRELFGETDETVNKRIHTAYRHGITPIVCVGEKLAEREAGITKQVVKEQVEKALEGLAAEQIEQLVIAYEPIWAIGTGKSSSAEDANEVIGYIREVVAGLYSEGPAEQLRIQYGGSVKPENIRQYLNQKDIDGALVGGASLDVDSFIALVKGSK